MRHFLRNLIFVTFAIAKISIAWGQAPAQRPSLYLSFEERMAASYALLAQGETEQKKNEIMARFKDLMMRNLQKGVQVRQVSNFNEFLAAYRGDFAGTNSLDLDMQLVEKAEARGFLVFQAQSPRVQRQIDNFLQLKVVQIKSLVSPEKLSSYQKFLSANAVDSFAQLVPAQRDLSLANLAKMAMDVSDKLVGDQLKQLDNIGEQMAQANLQAVNDPALKIVVETTMTEYFKRLNKATKKLIAADYLGGDLNADAIEKFKIMVRNSGPQFQKTLQVISHEKNIPPEMLKIFVELENSAKAVPWVQVEALLTQERNNYEFVYFERKPLGVGTMAQVHRAKIIVNGQRVDVVVRFIKPGMAERVMEDDRIMKEVAFILDANPEVSKSGLPKMSPFVEDATRTISAELDQPATIERQKLGAIAYNREIPFKAGRYHSVIDIHVPSIYPGAHKSDFMVQEMIIGKKLDKEAAIYKDAIPDLKRAVDEVLAEMWIEEAFFDKGFYHSDLHQGNFMVHVEDAKVHLNLLDFGMGGSISPELRAQGMITGIAVEIKDETLLGRSFWNLSDKNRNELNESQFKTLLAEKMGRIRAGQEPAIKIDEWTVWALDQGLRLPYEFMNLNRGLVTIIKLLEDSGSKESLATLVKKITLKNPLKTYRLLTEYGKLTTKDLAKMGVSLIGSKSAGKDTKIAPPAAVQAPRCEQLFTL